MLSIRIFGIYHFATFHLKTDRVSNPYFYNKPFETKVFSALLPSIQGLQKHGSGPFWHSPNRARLCTYHITTIDHRPSNSHRHHIYENRSSQCHLQYIHCLSHHIFCHWQSNSCHQQEKTFCCQRCWHGPRSRGWFRSWTWHFKFLDASRSGDSAPVPQSNSDVESSNASESFVDQIHLT